MFFFVILQSNKVDPLLNTKVDTCRTNNHSQNMTEHNTTRMRQLIETLNKASDAYYNGQGELMTDYEWDAAFDELKALEDITGIVLPDSPTTKVSEDDMAVVEIGWFDFSCDIRQRTTNKSCDTR